jgi:hypothetical protein
MPSRAASIARRAHFHLAQRLFGLQTPAALVDLAQRPFHGLGQKAEVLL